MRRVVAAIDVAVLLPCLALASLVLFTWWGRLDYPFDLEWMEGGMLVHAWRLQHGLPLYVEPDADWIPFIYPPGYSAVVAALGSIFGLTPGLARAVSGGASLAAAGALVFAGWRHGRSLTGGLLGASLFLLSYPNTGAFYDLIRPDGLAMGLTAWALVLGMERDRRWIVLSGLLLALGFTVKQNVALFGIPMVLGIFFDQGWRRALEFGVASAVPALLFVLGMEVATGGHFLAWLLEVPSAHPMVLGRFFPGTFVELGDHLGWLFPGLMVAQLLATLVWLDGSAARGVTIAAAILGAFGAYWIGTHPVTFVEMFGSTLEIPRMPRRLWFGEAVVLLTLGAAMGSTLAALGFAVHQRSIRGRWVYGTGVALVAFSLGGLMRAHHGGFVNVYIPVHFVVALTVATGVGSIRHRWRSLPVAVLVLVPALLQIWNLSDYAPERYLPTSADREAGQLFVTALEGCEEPVLSPYNPYLAVLAGHEPSWHVMALWDIQHPRSPYTRKSRLVREAVEAHRWSCVVMPNGRPMGYGFGEHYVRGVRPAVSRKPADRPGPATFMPRTGWRARPTTIWVPKSTE